MLRDYKFFYVILHQGTTPFRSVCAKYINRSHVGGKNYGVTTGCNFKKSFQWQSTPKLCQCLQVTMKSNLKISEEKKWRLSTWDTYFGKWVWKDDLYDFEIPARLCAKIMYMHILQHGEEESLTEVKRVSLFCIIKKIDI